MGRIVTCFGALAALFAVAGCRFAAGQAEAADPAPVGEQHETAPPPIALGFHVALDPVRLVDVRVLDGDTFDAGLERFRPEGIDTPEISRPHCELERQRAEAATAAASALFANAQTIVATPTETRRDRYGRVVARIEIDGRDFTALMIEQGHALPYRRPPGWNWCAPTPAACEANSDACGRARPTRS